MKTTLEIIERIISEKTKYLRTYTGKVVDLDDANDTNKPIGLVKCWIYELGWTNNDKAVWCSPNDKNSLLSPKKDDFVRIGFMNGDPSRPYYSGIIIELKDMLPDNYEDHKDQLIFESTDGRLYIKYNEEDKEYILEDDDGNKTTINEDGITEEDSNGNKKEYTDDGMKWTDTNNNVMEFKDTGIIITDKNNNKFEYTSTGMKWTDKNGKTIESTSSELKLLGATENFIKGLTLCNAFTTLCATISTATSGTTAQNAAGIETIKAAFATFNGQISTFKSTTIKGE